MTLYTGLIDAWRERLPFAPEVTAVSLAEGRTPLIRLLNIPREAGLQVEMYVKFEGLNPTGSFKDRGMTAAVTQAVDNHGLDETLNWTDSDDGEIAPEDQITYAVALAQMVDHGIHHRTQAMEMLRLLGVAGEKPWHPFDWDEAVRLG